MTTKHMNHSGLTSKQLSATRPTHEESSMRTTSLDKFLASFVKAANLEEELSTSDEQSVPDVVGPIIAPLQDELSESDSSVTDDDRISARKSAPKEGHPYSEETFIEVDGLIIYDPEWYKKRENLSFKRTRRGGRRNGVANKAA